MANSSRLLKNVSALAFGQLFTWASSAVLIILLPPYLGSSNLGRFAVALFVISILGKMVDLGGGYYLTKELPRLDREKASELISDVVVARLPVMFLVTLLAAAFIVIFVSDRSTQIFLLILLPTVTIQAAVGFATGALRGLQEMAPVAFSDSLSKVLSLAATLGVLALGGGIQALAAVSILATGASLLVAGLVLVRSVGLPKHWHMKPSKALILVGIPFFFSDTAVALHGQVDTVILSSLTSATVVGWYAAAYRVITLPIVVPAIITAAFFPAISQAAVTDFHRFAHLTNRALKLILIGTLPMSLGITILSARIIDVLHYPADFSHSIPLIAILAMHIPIAGVNMLIATCIFSLDKQAKYVTVVVIATILDVALNIPVVPLSDNLFNNGAVGSALITVTTEVAVFGLGLRMLPRNVLAAIDFGAVVRCFLPAIVMGAVVAVLRNQTIFVPVAAGALTYGVCVILFGAISKADVTMVLDSVRNRGSAKLAANEVV